MAKTGASDLPEPPALDNLAPPRPAAQAKPTLDGYTFEGYRNADGSVGTRNILAIATSVQCVAGVVDQVVHRIKAELLPLCPNVDGVVGINHAYGCGVAINAPDAVIPIRTLGNLVRNSNFGGEVMIVGLGCEKLRAETLVPDGDDAATLQYLRDPSLVGFSAMIDALMAQAETHQKRLDRRQRQTCPASDLVVGVQCGGSDRKLLPELLEKSAQRPLAVFCSSDIIAQGVLIEAQVRGLAVPGDIAIIGFGDQNFAAYTYPALTTVKIDFSLIGRLSAENLLARLKNTAVAANAVDVGFEIQVRETA